MREKFSSQAATDVLAALRHIAQSQGRQFQAVLDEALSDCVDQQQKGCPRRHVMASLASSLDEFDSLHRELAKYAVPLYELTVARFRRTRSGSNLPITKWLQDGGR